MVHDTLTSTMEDYLEAIYALEEEQGFARVKDIARQLSVTSSSVNAAIKVLTDKKLIVYEKYGYARLTKRGRELASEVKGKHDILFRFLTEFLLLDSEKAEKEACCIEHAISQETFLRLTKFFHFADKDVLKNKAKLAELF